MTCGYASLCPCLPRTCKFSSSLDSIAVIPHPYRHLTSHDQVHPGVGRCSQWHREGCHWYDTFLFVSEKLIRLDFFSASSTGLLLKTIGLKVTAIKIDPYMNIDAGTIRPTEHGKIVFLTNRPLKKNCIENLESKGKFMSLTMVERSIWIWETMNVILMLRCPGITISRLEKFTGKSLRKRFVTFIILMSYLIFGYFSEKRGISRKDSSGMSIFVPIHPIFFLLSSPLPVC